jgi:hypothetical protein
LSYLPTFLVDAVLYWISLKPEKALWSLHLCAYLGRCRNCKGGNS